MTNRRRLELHLTQQQWAGRAITVLREARSYLISARGTNSDCGYFLITVGEIQFPPNNGRP